MARRGKPQIEQGQSLDYQPGVANIAENKAQLDALKNANIDGQDVYPQSVSAQRMSAAEGFYIDESTWLADGVVTSDQMAADSVTVGALNNTVEGRIFVSGTAKTGVEGWATGGTSYTEINGNVLTTGTVNASSLNVSNLADISAILAGTITISSNSDGSQPTTGIYLTDTQILMTNAGTTYMDFDSSTSTYYVKGELTADKITILSNSNSSVTFGTDVTIDGDIVLYSSYTDGRIVFDGSGGNSYIDHKDILGVPGFGLVTEDEGGAIGLLQGASFSWTNYQEFPRVGIDGGDVYLAADGSSGASTTTRDVSIVCGTNSGNHVYLKRGTTTVMSFAGDSNDITIAGKLKTNGILGLESVGAGADIALTSDDDVWFNVDDDIGFFWHLAATTHYLYLRNNHLDLGPGVGIKFYNNASTADVGGTSTLFVASSNLYYRDPSGSYHQIAYV